MATNSDSFAYSTGDLATVSGGLWVKLRTGGQNIDVKATGDVTGVGTTDAPYYYNAIYASAALFSELKYKTDGANSEFALIVNCNTAQDGSRSYNILEFTRTAGGTFDALIGKIVTGTFTSLTTTTGLTINAGDVCRLENDGSGNLKGYINGSVISALNVNDTANNGNAFRVGIMPSSAGSERLDDWQGGDLTGGATATMRRSQMLTMGVG